MKRIDGRSPEQLREIAITSNLFEYAPGSVLFSIGKTKILCAVTLDEGVPPFLRGKGAGWLTAEYAMLPASTPTRTSRESLAYKRNGRCVEISRMIGRSLRSVVDLSGFGERTIMVDCDVLQADGGTRCGAICGAQAALNLAIAHWLDLRIITKNPLKDQLAAVSVGVDDGNALLDLNAYEDNNIDTDVNFVLTAGGEIVEIQATAEKEPVSWKQFEQMSVLAKKGVAQLSKAIVSATVS